MTTRQQWAIGIIVAIGLVFVPIIYDYVKNLPSPNLDVKIYTWRLDTTLNENKTIYTGLKTTFPSYITNIGNVPIHIVICDIYLNVNGKPSNLSSVSISEITYLKPQESYPYNFTKHFNVSLPVATTPLESNKYFLVVGYYTLNYNEIKYVWIEPPNFVKLTG